MTRSAISDLRRRGRAACAIAALLSAVPHVASADDGDAPDRVAAALFKSGRELVERGDWEAGCAKLAQSLARYPNASTQLNLARCAEHDGKIATAWAMYQRALGLVREVAGEKRREELQTIAVEGAARLEPRLPMLEVAVRTRGGEPLPSHLEVTESGRDMPRDQAVPLDPGPHEIVVTAEGFAVERRTVVLVEAEHQRVEIEMRSVAVPAPPKPVTTSRPQPFGPGDGAKGDGGGGAPAWAWVGIGAGVVTGALAVGFALDANAAVGELEDACGEDLVCDPDAAFRPDDLNDRKNRAIALAVALGAVSAVGLGVGIVGIATADSGSANVSVVPLPGGAGARLHGTF